MTTRTQASPAREAVIATPLVAAPDGRCLLKCEHRQVAGSFKWRGVVGLAELPPRTAVVAGSSGNHGLALALVASRARLTATVVMTRGADPAKRAAIEGLGATVVAVEGGNGERDAYADDLARATGALHVRPATGIGIITAYGGVGTEILAADPAVHTIVVPAGSGALAAGVALAARAVDRPVRVVAISPAANPSLARSLEAGRPVPSEPRRTVCDAALAPAPSHLVLNILLSASVAVAHADDGEVLAATEMLRRAGHDVEPTGALAVAGLPYTGHGPGVVAVLSGANGSFRSRLFGGAES
jgi:threonine dehydratase